MPKTLEDYVPTAHGVRVAGTPITRKQRSPSSRQVPRPKYANAVWWSFQNDKPLEVEVRVKDAADTVRALKTAARYLERNHPGNEVRVQISVESATEVDPSGATEVVNGAVVPKMVPKKGYSLVKFLGHEPFLLGRRIAKVALDNGDAGESKPAAPASHRRRTPVATRASHRRTALRRGVARPVITPHSPRMLSFRQRGLWRFPVVSGSCIPLEPGSFGGCYFVRKTIDFPYSLPLPWGDS